MPVENEESSFGSALVPREERSYRNIVVNYPVLYGLVAYNPSDLVSEIIWKTRNV